MILLIIVSWIIFVAIAYLLIKKFHYKKTDEEISKNQKETEKSARLVGYILILAGIGSSIFPSSIDLPWIPRIIIFLFGVALVLVPNKKLKWVSFKRSKRD